MRPVWTPNLICLRGVPQVGMLSSTVVAFEWAPSSSFVELLETIPDLVTRRLLTLEFLNGIFGRCGKLAVAKVINELSYLDTLVGDGILPSVRELSNCMVSAHLNPLSPFPLLCPLPCSLPCALPGALPSPSHVLVYTW